MNNKLFEHILDNQFKVSEIRSVDDNSFSDKNNVIKIINGIIDNLEGYENLSREQLIFKIEIVVRLLQAIKSRLS